MMQVVMLLLKNKKQGRWFMSDEQLGKFKTFMYRGAYAD